jgi:hypothetical protein
MAEVGKTRVRVVDEQTGEEVGRGVLMALTHEVGTGADRGSNRSEIVVAADLPPTGEDRLGPKAEVGRRYRVIAPWEFTPPGSPTTMYLREGGELVVLDVEDGDAERGEEWAVVFKAETGVILRFTNKVPALFLRPA